MQILSHGILMVLCFRVAVLCAGYAARYAFGVCGLSVRAVLVVGFRLRGVFLVPNKCWATCRCAGLVPGVGLVSC